MMIKLDQPLNRTNLQEIGGRAVSTLLMFVPFHALFVVVVGSLTGYGALLSIWKELLILLIAGLAVAVSWRQLSNIRQLWRWTISHPTLIMVGLIMLAGFLANIFSSNFSQAFFVGVKTTVAPLILFLAAQPFAKIISEQKLIRIILGSAIVVAILALIQFITVPTGFLASFGYNHSTILPFQGVHPDFPFGRTFSSLGGPNQLGTYLIIPSAIALAIAIRSRSSRQRILGAGLFLLFVLALITTFSRSALVGLMVAVGLTVILAVPKKCRFIIGSIFVAVGLMGALILWSVLTNHQTTALDRFLVRGDLTSAGLLGGDEGHISALVQGYSMILSHPGGLGFGSVGPASFYAAHPLITENWYLQIALEVGIIGLILMLVLLVHIAYTVWRQGVNSPIRIGYMAAILGIMVSALFLHSLADSTLAVITFGVGGLLYATSAPRGKLAL